MANPSTFAPARAPIVDEQRMMTWTFLQKLLEYENRLDPEVALFSNDAALATTDANEIEIGTATVSVRTGTIELSGKVNFTNGTAAGIVRIRKDSLTGDILDQSGIAVADETVNLIGVDSSPALSQIYKLTLIRSGGTDSSVEFRRLIADNRKR